MTGAPDTAQQRLESYRQLFDEALIDREQTDERVRFRFRRAPGIEARVRAITDLEHQCCAFLSFAVDASGDEVRVDVTTIDDPEAVRVLHEFGRLPESVSSGPAAVKERLETAGLTFVDPSPAGSGAASASCSDECATTTRPSGRNRSALGAAGVAVACVVGCAAAPLIIGALAALGALATRGAPLIAGSIVLVAIAAIVIRRKRPRPPRGC